MGGLQMDHRSHFILQTMMQRTQGSLRGWPSSLQSRGLQILDRSEQSVLDSSVLRWQHIVAAVVFFTMTPTSLMSRLDLRLIARLEAFKAYSYPSSIAN